MSEPLLCVEGLTKTFRGAAAPVIREVSFCVHPGEAFVLVGPSGCGKTTTLRTIMGFEAADRGVVKHAGRVLQGPGVLVPPERRGIGYVFQDYALFPHLSVRENVMYGIRGVPRRRRRQLANECLWMVGLMGLEDRRPHDLSGGQQQRVALARAIAPGSRVILLDEPFSNLDPDLRQATRAEVRMLAERTGLGIVLVTHDQEEALSTADRLGVMREGVLEQVGSPRDVYARPASAFVAQFLGRTNLIEARARGGTAETPLGVVPLAGDAAGRVVLSLRPEHLELRAPSDGLPVGRVVGREFKGHDMTYRVRLGAREYLVQTGFDCRFEPGQDVSLVPRAVAAIVESNALPQRGVAAAAPAPA